MQEVENSLRRLNTDYIDLYQMHRFDENTELEETLSALTDLVRQGKVRSIGSSMFAPDRIVEAQWVSEARGLERFRCEQFRYSIFQRELERFVLPACQRYGMGVITWSPLDTGWLSGRYLSSDDVKQSSRVATQEKMKHGTFNVDHKIVQLKLKLSRELTGLATEAGMTLPQMAIAFTLEHPGVSACIIGPRTHSQMDSLLESADLRLDKEVLDRIDLAILDALHKNGRISNVNLAKAVNLSPSPCLDRVKRLESEGYIEGYSARLNPEKLGQHLVAHVEIRLKSSTESVFETFKQHIMRIPHVVSCDMVAGGFDYLVKIRVPDMTVYREVLGQIVEIPGVGTNHTYMVIEHVKPDLGVGVL